MHNHHQSRGLFLAIGAGLLWAGWACQAATWYVSPAGNDTGAGTDWRSAKCTIQAAVDSAVAGDTVMVTNGIYTLAHPITLAKPIEVRAVNGPAVTVLRGRNGMRCVTLDHAAAALAGFTITNGQVAAYENGGGIWSRGIIRDCVITGNQTPTGSGGGVYNLGEVWNCVITGNDAGDCGGGLYNQGVARNCLIVGNSAANGGGAFNFTDSLIENCTVVSNTADEGGGVSNYGAIRNSIVVQNKFFNLTSLFGNGLDCVTYSCAEPRLPGQGNVASGPGLTEGFRLIPGSRCIDAGTNQVWMAGQTALGGNARIMNGRVDLGAYEFDGRSAKPTPTKEH